jgi:preprotein translocase subunit SecG
MLMSFLLSIHVILSIAIIVLVLLQQGKGADAGAAFGGSSANFFGSAGAGNFLTKTTTWLAIAFFVISLALAYLISHREKNTQVPSLLDIPVGGVVGENPAVVKPALNDDLPPAPTVEGKTVTPVTSTADDLPPALPTTTP